MRIKIFLKNIFYFIFFLSFSFNKQMIAQNLNFKGKKIYVSPILTGQGIKDENTNSLTDAVQEVLINYGECVVLQRKRASSETKRIKEYGNKIDTSFKAEYVLIGKLIKQGTNEHDLHLQIENIATSEIVSSAHAKFKTLDLIEYDVRKKMLTEMIKALLGKKASGLVSQTSTENTKVYTTENLKGTHRNMDAYFSVFYFTQEKRWMYSSEEYLQDGSQLKDLINDYLPNFEKFDSSIGIIALGVASQEGSSISEELRADRRADALLYLLRTNVPCKGKELYKLNLGQHKVITTSLSEEETAYQRRVIVIGVIRRDNRMGFEDLKQALYNALNNSTKLNFFTNRYSLFRFEKM